MTTTVSVTSTVTLTTTRTLTRTILTSTPLLTASSVVRSGTGLNDGHEQAMDSLYPYMPSLPLSVIFTILYFIVTLHHGYLSLYLPSRPSTVDKHRYTVPLFVAALFSTLGYLLRSISIQEAHVSNVGLYSISTALILISPIFVCATLYLLLARLITRCLPSPTTAVTPTTPRHITHPPTQKAPQTDRQRFLALRPKLLGVVFITSDVLAFLTQISGSIVASSHHWTEPTLTQGTHLVLAGLCLQLATFLLYVLVLHLFCRRVQSSHTTGFNPLIWKVVVAAWIASGFVLVRSVFRVVEFGMGAHGYPFLHEWCLYVFEGFDVWVALVVLGWWHPVKWIQERAAVDRNAGGDKFGRAFVVRAPDLGIVGSGGASSKGYGQEQGHVRRRSKLGFMS